MKQLAGGQWVCAAPPLVRDGVLVSDACSARALGVPGLQQLP